MDFVARLKTWTAENSRMVRERVGVRERRLSSRVMALWELFTKSVCVCETRKQDGVGRKAEAGFERCSRQTYLIGLRTLITCRNTDLTEALNFKDVFRQVYTCWICRRET